MFFLQFSHYMKDFCFYTETPLFNSFDFALLVLKVACRYRSLFVEIESTKVLLCTILDGCGRCLSLILRFSWVGFKVLALSTLDAEVSFEIVFLILLVNTDIRKPDGVEFDSEFLEYTDFLWYFLYILLRNPGLDRQ